MRITVALLCGVVCGLLLTSFAACADNRARQLDELLREYHELGQFNGVVLVADNNKTLLRDGYGYADIENQAENTPELRFLAGSITKSVTALITLQLERQGVLDLDATINEYLPDYRADVGSKLSLRHLLTHTDGLPDYTWNSAFWEPWENGEPLATQPFIERFSSGDLDFEPGSEYRYGNAGYSILGAIIESVSGKSFADVVEELVLVPFDLGNSGIHRNENPPARLASGHEVSVDGYRSASPVYKPLFAAGSMYWTVDDLHTYSRALSDASLVSTAVQGSLFEDRIGADEGTFAYGWNIGQTDLGGAIPPAHFMATNGEINGYNAMLVRIPADDQVIVLLNNTGETNLLEIASNIIQVLHGLPATPPEPKVRDVFLQTLREQSASAATDYYRLQHQQNPDDFLFMPWPLRILADQLIEEERFAEARLLLNLNLESNPGDPRSLQMLQSIAEAEQNR